MKQLLLMHPLAIELAIVVNAKLRTRDDPCLQDGSGQYYVA